MRYLCLGEGCKWRGYPSPRGRWVSGRKGEGLRYNGLCCPICGGELVGFDIIKDTENSKIYANVHPNTVGILARCQKGHEKEILFDGHKINVNKIWINPPDLVLPDCCKTSANIALDFLRRQYDKR